MNDLEGTHRLDELNYMKKDKKPFKKHGGQSGSKTNL